MDSWYQKVLNPAKICTSTDHTRKKNCEGNPWCLYGFGEKKEGVWKNPDVILDVLCENITKTRSVAQPCGLHNAGATCYLSVILQTIFHNLLWRNSMLKLADETTADPIYNSMVSKFTELFVHMEFNVLHSINPVNLIECFGVNKQIQQDPQEFLSLFLEKLSKADVSSLLNGKEDQKLQCGNCGELRHCILPFNSIQLAVTKCNNIHDSLLNYSTPEVLSSCCCSMCFSSVMSRSTTIVEAPAIFLVHLLRYEYDRESNTKRKLQTDFHISEEITICNEQYELTSVIYHIGTSAHGGHYVCDCKIWKENRWFHLDDERVDEIPPPFAEQFSTSDIKDLNVVDLSEESKSSTRRKRKRTNDDDPVFNSPALNRQKDCYILIYVRKTDMENAVAAAESSFEHPLSSPLVESVLDANSQIRRDVEHAEYERHSYLQKIKERMNVYEAVHSILLPNSVEDDFVIVESKKLKNWIIGDPSTFTRVQHIGDNLGISKTSEHCLDVEILENVPSIKSNVIPIKCQHDKVNPKALGCFKVLSRTAFDKINQNLGCNCLPEVATRKSLMCHDCWSTREDSYQVLSLEEMKVTKLLHTIQSEIQCRNQRQYLEYSDAEKSYYWLSKKFLQEVKKYSARLAAEVKRYSNNNDENGNAKSKNIDLPTVDSLRDFAFSQNDSYNGKILCEAHGQLIIDAPQEAILISEECIRSIEDVFQPFIVYAAEAPTCVDCYHERHTDEMIADRNKCLRHDQRNDGVLMNMFKRKSPIPPELMKWSELGSAKYLQLSEARYYLMSSSWLSEWRRFIRTGAKPVDAISPNCLLCNHSKLVVCDILRIATGELKSLVDKFHQQDYLHPVELIQADEFQKLCLNYGEGYLGRECEWPAVKLVETNGEPVLVYDPPLCKECLAEKWNTLSMNNTLFVNTPLEVIYFGNKDLMNDFLRKKDSGQKVALRSRGSSLQKLTVIASHDDTIGLMKLKIFENCQTLDLIPAQQILFDELGTELKDNGKRMSDYGINSESMIFVIKSGDKSTGWMDSFYECYQREQEEGFKGGICNQTASFKGTSTDSLEIFEIID